MWIDTLTDETAPNVLGRYWQEILVLTRALSSGAPQDRPAALTNEDFAGARYFFGTNGPSVLLFLRGWSDVECGVFPPPPEERKNVLVWGEMDSTPDSDTWQQALREAGIAENSGQLANVWKSAGKVGLAVGSHAYRDFAAAAAGELAQMPGRDVHFFLDLMPWVFSGQRPRYWHDETNSPIIEWSDADVLERIRDDALNRDMPEHNWPTAGIGYRVRDEFALADAAVETDCILLLADASPARLQYIGEPGHRPCPLDVSGEFRTEPPNIGLLAAGEGTELRDEFIVAANDEGRIVRDRAGNALFEPFELLGAYDVENGANRFSTALMHTLNQRLGNDLVQGGPPNLRESVAAGEQNFAFKPFTVFMPDRGGVHLTTKEDYESLCEEFELRIPDA